MLDERQLDLVKEQVVVRLYHGDDVVEIYEWLLEEKGIPEGVARAMMKLAVKDRRKEVRERALIRMVLSGVPILGLVGYASLTTWGMLLSLWYLVILGGLGWYFVENLGRYLTGEQVGSVQGGGW